MSAQTFLIAHGEKLAIAVVAIVCAVLLWTAISDPTIRPAQNQQQIEAVNAKIDKVFKSQSPPVMKEPRPYLDQLLARLGESAPVTPTMAWLTNPPDKGRGPPKKQGDGPGITPGLYLYIYELLAPTVAIEDAIGSLRISVTAPAAESGPGRRISGEAERSWTRDDKGPVVNKGRHLGLQVQIRVGDNEWKPLVLPGAGKDGVLPLAGLPEGAVTIPTPEPWQTHRLRARIIAAATALDLESPLGERPRQSIVVHAGPASAGPTEDQAVLDKATAQVSARDGALFKTLLRPVQGPLPAGAKLEPGEKLFLGPWSTEAKVDATASVRFALVGLSTAPLPEDPAKARDVGKFLLLRLFEEKGERKWMEKPLEEKFGVGDVLGIKKVEIPSPFPPNQKIRVDLPTPFVVDKLIKDQDRVLYWFVKPVARQGGGKGRDLLLDKKTIKTDIVELKNPDTGSVLVLTKLISINPPAGRDLLFFPHRAAALVEKDEFTKAPSEFRQYGLVPEAPKAFKPGTGPLEELHKAKLAEGALDAESYVTDTDYYVFPDNRIAWWELIERTMKVHDPDNVMAAKEATPDATAPKAPAVPEAPPAPVQPKGKQPAGTRPGATPPGMPPGMAPPPGMMPPGMPPAPPR